MERGKRSRALVRHRELLELESALWLHDIAVAGLDEAGAGPLAGPVVAACVVLEPGRVNKLVGVDDSKQIAETQRVELASRIEACAVATAVCEASVQEIDSLNIRAASLLAMSRALAAVLDGGAEVGHLLVDARRVPGTSIRQSEIVRGDARSLSIAAASILAKVSRDRVMVAAGAEYQGYGFEKHKGYGTRDHQEALRKLGPCPIHRRSFAPVRAAERNGGLFQEA